MSQDVGTISDLINILNKISGMIWPMIGVALFGMFIYGGFMWTMSGENAQQKQQAQSLLMWAIIGTVVALMSIVIMKIFSAVMTGGAIDFTNVNFTF